jgi:thiol-disulfide isomerase/thioredoxin
MRVKNILLSVFVLLQFAFTPKQPLPGIVLLDLKGNKTSLASISRHQATAIIMLSPECPLCQSYTLTINNLAKAYEAKGVDFIGVIPTKDFTMESIRDYRLSYKPVIRLLRDPENRLVKLLGATITPEVFLFDQHGNVKYSGRIDNWAYELGKKRKIITEHNLKDAIEAVLAGKPVAVTKTKAVGCFIE